MDGFQHNPMSNYPTKIELRHNWKIFPLNIRNQDQESEFWNVQKGLMIQRGENRVMSLWRLLIERAKLLKSSLDLAEGLLLRVDSNQPPIKPNFWCSCSLDLRCAWLIDSWSWPCHQKICVILSYGSILVGSFDIELC